jgi:hypothetical protein
VAQPAKQGNGPGLESLPKHPALSSTMAQRGKNRCKKQKGLYDQARAALSRVIL